MAEEFFDIVILYFRVVLFAPGFDFKFAFAPYDFRPIGNKRLFLVPVFRRYLTDGHEKVINEIKGEGVFSQIKGVFHKKMSFFARKFVILRIILNPFFNEYHYRRR